MALGVAILRLVMLLLNIYETLKVLKHPRRSARNSGQPTIRALSQRKRSMKGCLAVWIVWCCFMTYERMAEGIVSLFIPFYDEVKSLVLLFLILTRARGAEPIYLHVIRPLLKPYTSTVDAVFDVARMFGDIIFLLSTYPFHIVSTWWHELFAYFERPAQQEADRGLYTEVQQALYSVSYQTPIQPANRRSFGVVHEENHATLAAVQNSAPRPRVSAEHVEGSLHGVHQIWHPPRSSYHDEDGDDEEVDPAPLGPEIESEESRQAREQIDEWRQYPPFPSAYPPTPIMPASSSRLPLVNGTLAFVAQNFSPIAEDAQREQDFGQSLPSPPELSNSGSVRDSSDEDNILGIRHGTSNMTTTTQDDTMDEEEEEEEEDDFNVTLRTPGPLAAPDITTARMTRSRTREALPASSDALDIPLPSLLSRLSSDASSVSNEASSSASLIGRKRSRDRLVPALAPAARARATVSALPLESIEDDSELSATSSVEVTDDDTDADASGGASEPKSPLVKRRRVASPPSRVQPRRTTRNTSHEPPAAPPPSRPQRQRQVKATSQMSDGPTAAGARTSSRRAMGVTPLEAAPGRRTVVADSGGEPAVPSAGARSSRRGGSTVAAKRR